MNPAVSANRNEAVRREYMLYRRFVLEEYFDGLSKRDNKASLTVYCREKEYGKRTEKKHPCVMICPGGAYEYLCEREAEPVALRLLGAGYNAAVCRYGIAEDGAEWPDQLIELSAAVALLRRNADALGCDPDRIIVMGFSAGGHAAASLGVFHAAAAERLRLEKGENRPNGLVLCYPVISGGEYAHRDSFRNLLGKQYSAEMADRVSIEKNINADVPPVFIWHTRADATVPVENTELMEAALKQRGIPVEAHYFTEGVHGLALADETTAAREEHICREAAEWFGRFLEWSENL